ncbi:hypothetical protein Dimus_001408, partial [Dionaea muscipula]
SNPQPEVCAATDLGTGRTVVHITDEEDRAQPVTVDPLASGDKVDDRPRTVVHITDEEDRAQPVTVDPLASGDK